MTIISQLGESLSSPNMGTDKNNNQAMADSIENLFAVNLRAATRARGLNIKSLSAKSGVGTGTVGRLLNGESSATLRNVHALAKALRLEPWQMLTEGLDANNPPLLRAVSETEKALYAKIEQLFMQSQKAKTDEKAP